MPSRRHGPRRSDAQFYKCFLSGESKLARLELRGESRRVLSACRAAMDWENWVRASLREVADAHGIPWRQFTRGMHQLRSCGLIRWELHPVGGELPRVSLELGWRGRDARHARALERQARAEILPLFPDAEAV